MIHTILGSAGKDCDAILLQNLFGETACMSTSHFLIKRILCTLHNAGASRS